MNRTHWTFKLLKLCLAFVIISVGLCFFAGISMFLAILVIVALLLWLKDF